QLSSGLRINRAADDAAGLAVSEKMRAQIFGLDQAQTNASDAISMIQTGEGVMDTVHSSLQRIRKLILQASNDTYTSQDRKYIQDEINELVGEVDRISHYTEFNTKKLLNGDAVGNISSNSNQLLTGAIVGDKVISADYSVTVLKAGSASNVFGTVGFTATENTMSTVDIASGSELHIMMDGKTSIIQLDASDTLQDLVNKINSSKSGVQAGYTTVGAENYLTMTAIHSGSRFNIGFGNDPDGAASKLGIFGGNIDSEDDDTVAVAGQTYYRFTSGTNTQISITNISNQSIFPTDVAFGVSLGVFESESDIFTEKELSNPIDYATGAADAASAAQLSTSELLKGIAIRVDEDLDFGFYDVNTWNPATDHYYRAATPNASTQDGAGDMSIASTRLYVRDNRQVFQIGSNEAQTVTAAFGNISAEALGLTVNLQNGGFDYNGRTKLETGEVTGDFSMNISVMTKESSEEALKIVDSAIDRVNTVRGRLGAYQNSLEKSVDYLGIAYENQSASESRIRDLDMAKQITEFVKQQILMQSGTAMLAQSNIKPESVLNLLS
ncbi:MAG: flagellin, partial [Candidatus Wallbacteria bacterium]|nr:flagellin [Candidatus Wallbacteria bacterium]